MRIFKTILFVFFLFGSTNILADDSTQQLVQLLSSINSMQSNFVQTVYDSNQNVLQETSGKLSLQRPGKFRWVTESPSQQILIADGKRVWFYDIDLAQVSVRKQETINDGTPALLLSGAITKLAQDFFVAPINSENNTQAFKLTPKQKNNLFQSVELYFTNGKLIRMRLMDNLNQTTEIKFSNVKLNPVLDMKLFLFTPPTGVDVVTQ